MLIVYFNTNSYFCVDAVIEINVDHIYKMFNIRNYYGLNIISYFLYNNVSLYYGVNVIFTFALHC